MAVLVSDPWMEQRLHVERHALGADRYDEVWEGTYHMTPMPDDEHQEIVSRWTSILELTIGWPGLGKVRPGVNVSDREENWQFNYRVPDVAVFLDGGRARNCGTHWCGGPDFLVEVLSRLDSVRDKWPFYAAIGVREILLINREPWELEIWRPRDYELQLAAHASLEKTDAIECSVLPLQLRIVAGVPRPRIEVTCKTSGQSWLV